jgi:hypothetical protein
LGRDTSVEPPESRGNAQLLIQFLENEDQKFSIIVKLQGAENFTDMKLAPQKTGQREWIAK